MSTRRTILAGALPAVALLTTTEIHAAASSGNSSKVMTRERFDKYVSLYNAGDPEFARFYNDDVVMETVPPLRGAVAIAEFSRELRTYFVETLRVDHYVADETGAAAQFLVELRCVRDMPTASLAGVFGRAVRKGQVLRQRGMTLYGVENGKFKWIRAAPPIVLQDWS